VAAGWDPRRILEMMNDASRETRERERERERERDREQVEIEMLS
jgi:hypothetical protein